MSKPISFWECRKCGYRMENDQYVLVRMDFGCPRCETSLVNFKGIPEEDKEGTVKNEL